VVNKIIKKYFKKNPVIAAGFFISIRTLRSLRFLFVKLEGFAVIHFRDLLTAKAQRRPAYRGTGLRDCSRRGGRKEE
jgi:hypothetical protein